MGTGPARDESNPPHLHLYTAITPFGRNGNDVVLDRVDGKNWGANVCVRFGELPPADYIVVIDGREAGLYGPVRLFVDAAAATPTDS